MRGKTHDLQETKADIRFYYGLVAFIMIIGLFFFFFGVSVENLPFLILFSVTGLGLILIGVSMIKKIKKMNTFVGYGVDEENGFLWSAVFEDGKVEPLEVFKIPFTSIQSIVLAPYELYHSVRTSDTVYHNYFYVPVVLLVYEEAGERHFTHVTFKTDANANVWLQRTQAAGLSLEITDEAVNNLYNYKNAADLILTDLFTKPFSFYGHIRNYINRQQKYDRPLTKYKKGESMTLNLNHIFTFKWKKYHIFIVSCLLMSLLFLFEQWYVSTNGIEVTIFSAVLATMILVIGHLLYSYTFKSLRAHSHFIIFGLSSLTYLISSSIVMLAFQLPNFDERFHFFTPYMIGLIPVVIISYLLRKWKPAHHHEGIQKQKNRMRNIN
ncbi:hypothetical protein [Halalkalibacter urbisdiaboli]|uniref:hypothetical protein n=1 Tax=Halalkalibacter urbisdiaboli TaxID=1960589 RepID=UPI000B4306F4|nr:hypothetical protein [Halalkalibacter urbisdiaboli]